MPITDRRLAGVFSAAVLAAVISPVRQNWRREPRDGFPLSYYPMFSRRRNDVQSEHHVLGVEADGGRTPLPHGWVGPGGGNQVRKQVNRAVRGGRADELAVTVASSVARRRAPGSDGARAGPDVVAVEVVTSRYRLDDYFAGRKEPVRRRVRARAPVPGNEP